MSERLEAEVVIIGCGIAGLWSAKELVDRGYKVDLVEKSEVIADGATTRNEGWLHSGTYHSIAVEDTSEIESVVSDTRWGHEAIIKFAPECIDHGPTLAVVTSDEMGHKAVRAWDKGGVNYQEVNKNSITDKGQLNTERLSAVFRVEDKSVNTRVLCSKLANYVVERGGRIFTGANFTPESEGAARIITKYGEDYTIAADRFLITAGAGTKEVVEAVTGEPFPCRFFKAHLMVLPRLTVDNYFHLEAGEAGLMNHGQVSVAGINRDGIELSEPNYDIDMSKEELIYSALTRMIPDVGQHNLGEDVLVRSVACNKPDFSGVFGGVQSLGIRMFEPQPKYLCALPGKMTVAPYLAKKVVDRLELGLPLASVYSQEFSADDSIDVALRPADLWVQRQSLAF